MYGFALLGRAKLFSPLGFALAKTKHGGEKFQDALHGSVIVVHEKGNTVDLRREANKAFVQEGKEDTAVPNAGKQEEGVKFVGMGIHFLLTLSRGTL